MTPVLKKYLAVILAIWLPLFSGNALAATVVMQAMGGSGHSMQQDKHHAHCDAAMQPARHAADQDQFADQQDQSTSADCGVCHLVCCGYLAVASIEVMDAPSTSQKFPPVFTQFQSITSYPLDPPPLACA